MVAAFLAGMFFSGSTPGILTHLGKTWTPGVVSVCVDQVSDFLRSDAVQNILQQMGEALERVLN